MHLSDQNVSILSWGQCCLWVWFLLCVCHGKTPDFSAQKLGWAVINLWVCVVHRCGWSQYFCPLDRALLWDMWDHQFHRFLFCGLSLQNILHNWSWISLVFFVWLGVFQHNEDKINSPSGKSAGICGRVREAVGSPAGFHTLCRFSLPSLLVRLGIFPLFHVEASCGLPHSV